MTSSRPELEHDAMSWLVRGLPRCVVPPDPHHSAGVKALMDLSLLTVVRAQLHPGDEWTPVLVDHIRRQAATEQYRGLVQQNPELVNYYGLPFAALVTAGETDPAVGHIVRTIVDSGSPLRSDRPPHRLLDLLYYLRLLGVPESEHRDLELRALSSVERHLDGQHFTEQAAYALAHAVLYATDFGLRSALWPGASLPGLRLVVEKLLDDASSAGDVDLAAELVCGVVCLGDRSSPAGNEFWLALESSRRDDGSHVRYLRTAPDVGRVSSGWAQRHHCTVVVTMALMMERRAQGGGPYPVVQHQERQEVG